jgi:pimeloyl-ACP methyl ester carboxylesterase
MFIADQEWQYIITEGGKEVILMLPGSTATGESNWREIPRFTPDYRVIFVSYPPVRTIEALLEGVCAILDAEAIESVNIIGASMGGALAHWFIRRFPQRVNKLVIMSLGMPSDTTASSLRKVAFTISLLPSPIIRKMFEREAKKLVSVLPGDEATLMSAYFRDLYRNDIDKKTIIGHFRLVADIATKVSALGLDKPFTGSTPVLIINAADDETVTAEARNAIYVIYPNCRKVLFPSGGHTLFGRREELFSAIDSFIR